MGEFFKMSGAGHETVLKWGQSAREIDMARETFDNYKDRGFTMYQLDKNDNQGKRMDEFDPSVNGIIAVPQMKGG